MSAEVAEGLAVLRRPGTGRDWGLYAFVPAAPLVGYFAR